MRRSGVAVLIVMAVALSGACDRRVEEPSPPPRPVAETIKPVAPPPAPTVIPPAPGAASTDGRCVHAMPASPPRPIASKPAVGCPKEPKRPDLGSANVTVMGAAATAKVAVEVAAKDKDRQRGLMYRTSMADDKGMLFVFETREEHSFWMHNTCIPLDMIFIDHDGLIVGIEENTPTLSDDTFTAGCASKYVLEVNAGWSRANGVKPGQWVKIEGL